MMLHSLYKQVCPLYCVHTVHFLLLFCFPLKLSLRQQKEMHPKKRRHGHRKSKRDIGMHGTTLRFVLISKNRFCQSNLNSFSKGKSKESAKREYVELLLKKVPDWERDPVVTYFETELKRRPTI